MSEVEKFYQWMQSINNAFLSDHEQMTNAFRIVALENENAELKEKLRTAKSLLKEGIDIMDIVVNNPEIVKYEN